MKVIGLMSGTSMDGIDASLVEIQEGKDRLSIRLLSSHRDPYPFALRERLLVLASGEPQSVALLCHLNAYLGELFARCAIRLLSKAGLSPGEVDLIGSHGQTVHHLPKGRREGRFRVRSTLQIGEPAVIAERTGVTTIADFRPRDLAAGGEGAPLTPFAHDLLFRHAKRSRAVLNLGGIANLTYLPAGQVGGEILAFDTGPGNMLIDERVRRLSSGRAQMDRGGRIAAGGAIHAGLLARWLRDPFLRSAPPKSTGREEFGPSFVDDAMRQEKKERLSAADCVATLTAFTAESIVDAVRRFILPRGPLEELFVGGGGRSNPFLIKRLEQGLSPVRLLTFEDLGLSSRFFESTAFALLAYQTLRGRAGNLPAVTGARRPVILGKIVPGRVADQ